MQDNTGGGVGGGAGSGSGGTSNQQTTEKSTKKVLRPLGKLGPGILANAALKATILKAINKSKGKMGSTWGYMMMMQSNHIYWF